MQILGEENFTPEVVEYIHKNKAKAAIDKLERSEAENLGFKYSDDVRLTIDSEAIQHTLKRHGAESDLVKNSGQIPVEYKDIAEYRNIVKNADESLRARDNAGNDVIVSYRQINGYAVVVEQIRKKNNELSFKTMFKQNGDYKNSKSYKETSALNQTLSIGYEPSANSFSKTEAPQKAVNESIAENEAKKSLFESSENFYDYEKKLLREISIEGLDKQNAKDKLYFNTIQTYMEKLGNFEKELSNIVQEVRPFLHLNQKDKIIDKLYRQRDKKDFRNSLKELVYFYVHKDKLGIDDIHTVMMDYAESMAKYVKGLLPYDNHLSFEKLVKEKKLFDEVIRQENKPSVKPLDEFGVNFEGFKGKEAVDKLLSEKRGQVRGAFYKEGLGEIDLVWGEITDLEKHKGYGLAHILDKRKSEFVEQGASQSEAAQKAAEFAKNEISNIMQNGKIINKANEATRIETQDYRLILKQNWKGEPTKNKWLVTAYMKKEKGESISSSPFTKEDNLSLNSNESIAQKALNLHEKLYLKDNDTPLNVEYKIVNKDDIKPTFTLSKTQFRSQKQEDLIKKIKENFNPDLLVNIRGDLKKGNPIITKQGEVISGNHRAAALKELEGENLAKYQNAVKEAFGVELKENEVLVRVADTSEAEIRRFSAASNEGLENNLGEQGVSLFAKYQDKIKALKEAKKPFVADDVYNLKYLVNKALGESSITKENDTSKALFASLAKGRNNTILKALNELEKENLEQVSKVANMFFDNAGAFYNLTHDLDLPKMQNL
ncbi:hypothetical protein ACHPPE_001842, partial [Campylobacter upsaliensis]